MVHLPPHRSNIGVLMPLGSWIVLAAGVCTPDQGRHTRPNRSCPHLHPQPGTATTFHCLSLSFHCPFTALPLPFHRPFQVSAGPISHVCNNHHRGRRAQQVYNAVAPRSKDGSKACRQQTAALLAHGALDAMTLAGGLSHCQCCRCCCIPSRFDCFIQQDEGGVCVCVGEGAAH